MLKIIDRKSVFKILCAFLFLVVGCNSTDKTEKNITFKETAAEKQGTLLVVANGEDFVRNGFITKDGWEIDFTKLRVSLGNVVAYQTETSFDPDQDQAINSKLAIPITKEIKVVDLTQEIGSKNLTPQNLTIVKKIMVPVGLYRAISWEMLPTNDFGFEAQTIFLQGNAMKNGKKINFELGLSVPTKYICGEFIGENRKGIVTKDKSTELEMTFHFDHLFGDNNLPSDDELNLGALGFQPLAELATIGNLRLDWQELQQKLDSADVEKLTQAIAGLGHVGEGHCKAISL